MRPKVSVVLAVWNAAWCVERALDSVLAQDVPVGEILLCDDGSTDGTPDLVERRYGGHVRVVRLPHRNAAATRVHGLAEAQGEWLAFLDADDWWEPHKNRAQLDYLAAHPDVELLWSDGDFVSTEGVLRASWLADYFDPVTEMRGDLFAPLANRCFPLMSSTLVRAEVYRAAGGMNPGIVYSHDYDLWLRLAAKSVAAVMPDRLVHYWYHAGSLSRSYEARHRDDRELMWRIARGELRPEAALRRLGRERAAALAYDIGLLCLRDGRGGEARAMFRDAAGAGPAARRAFALAGACAPGFLVPALKRLPGLKGRVGGARRRPGRLAAPERES